MGPWTGDGVARWRGGLQTIPGAAASALPSSPNGADGLVHDDGTIACRVRCDTTAILPPSGGTPPAAPAGTASVPDACKLLTPAEVADVLGGTTKHRTADPGRENSACMWHDAPAALPGNTRLSLQAARMTRAMFESALSRQSGARPLNGLGELANFFRDGDLLLVWDRGYELVVGNHTATPLETGKLVAALALERP